MNRTSAVFISLLLFLNSSNDAFADDDKWKFTILLPMIWATDITGEIDVDGDVTGIDISFSDLNNLWMGYRYMRIKDKITEGGISVKTDFVQQGPTMGWAFTI